MRGARKGLPQSLVYSDNDDLLVKLYEKLCNYSKEDGEEMIEEFRKCSLERFKDEIAYYVDNYLE
jgi:hypothetical protein